MKYSIIFNSNDMFECDNFYNFENRKKIENKEGIPSKKELLLKAKGMIMLDKSSNTVLANYPIIRAQHYYPLSILDYAYSLKNYYCKNISSVPIMSVDSHDYNFCDFHCKDCLAVDTRKWAEKNLGFTTLNPEHYEKILKELARYSKERGFNSVRFEMSGEGNPDMYPHRARIIKFASERCGMLPVYITSGSKLDDELIDCLAKYASYVRFSFPGITEEAYDIYSNQVCSKENRFTLQNSINNIKKLSEKRKQYGRENELLIGARTCLRPENDGNYLKIAKILKEVGVESFQIVQILVPEGMKIEEFPLSEVCKEELKELNKNECGFLHIQIPLNAKYTYYDRKIENSDKPSECYSSVFSPILYGPHLIVCTHWEKIKDVTGSHYGKMSGDFKELEILMNGERACRLRSEIPQRCSSCCSIFDNHILNSIKSHLMLMKKPEDAEFYLVF